MMRCPVCRADDNQTEQCRRCKADLTLLVRLERQRAARLVSAERHAGRGEAEACLTDAQSAHALRVDGESLRLIALAALLKRDFAAAWKAYQKRAKLV
jgi:hypothetical protein